jgi:hypothetical protein
MAENMLLHAHAQQLIFMLLFPLLSSARRCCRLHPG